MEMRSQIPPQRTEPQMSPKRTGPQISSQGMEPQSPQGFVLTTGAADWSVNNDEADSSLDQTFVVELEELLQHYSPAQ